MAVQNTDRQAVYPTEEIEQRELEFLAVRVRIGLAIGAMAAILFAIGDLRSLPDHRGALWAMKAVVLLAMLAAARTARRSSSRNEIRTVAVLVFALALLAAATSAILLGDSWTPPIAIAGALVASAGLIPWGAVCQAFAAAVGILAWLACLVSVGGSPGNARVGFLLCALGSVVLAKIVESQRGAILRREAQAVFRERMEATVSTSLATGARELFRHLGEQDLLAHACRIAGGALGADVTVALVSSEREPALHTRAQHGLSEEEWAGYQVVEISGDVSQAIRRRLEEDDVSTIDVDEPPTSSADLGRRSIAQRVGFGPLLLLALRSAGRLTGVLVACRRTGRPVFGDSELQIARGLVPLVGASLENQRLLQALETANQAQAEFLAGMSHELRTPLHVITGYLDMLLEGAAGKLSVDQTELCGRIRASAVQQLFLVGEALEISRRDAQGRIPLRNEELSVEALVADLAREIAFGRSERGVRTVWQVPAETPWIESDAVKLRMILRNLIENALQFTRAGEVCARVEVVAEKLVLEVRDTGIGIPPEERERIFEAFRQVGGTRSGGLGLGLYIVRRLAQAMNGTVEVQSRVGEGSVFTVRLPVRVAEAQPKPLAAPAPPAESVARRAVAGV